MTVKPLMSICEFKQQWSVYIPLRLLRNVSTRQIIDWDHMTWQVQVWCAPPSMRTYMQLGTKWHPAMNLANEPKMSRYNRKCYDKTNVAQSTAIHKTRVYLYSNQTDRSRQYRVSLINKKEGLRVCYFLNTCICFSHVRFLSRMLIFGQVDTYVMIIRWNFTRLLALKFWCFVIYYYTLCMCIYMSGLSLLTESIYWLYDYTLA